MSSASKLIQYPRFSEAQVYRWGVYLSSPTLKKPHRASIHMNRSDAEDVCKAYRRLLRRKPEIKIEVIFLFDEELI